MGNELAVLEVQDKLLAPGVSVDDASRALLALSIPQRALVVGGAFSKAVEERPVGARVDEVKETVGKRLERILEGTPDHEQDATLAVMIKERDIEAVLSMVRGQAGDFSSTAERLTPELIEELFANDPGMSDPFSSRSDRLVTISYTLIVETRSTTDGVNRFFSSDVGQRLLQEIVEMSSEVLDSRGDETADQVIRHARNRDIPIPATRKPPIQVDGDDDDEEEEGHYDTH